MHTVWEPAIPFMGESLQETNLIAARLIKGVPLRSHTDAVQHAYSVPHFQVIKQLPDVHNKTNKLHIIGISSI